MILNALVLLALAACIAHCRLKYIAWRDRCDLWVPHEQLRKHTIVAFDAPKKRARL